MIHEILVIFQVVVCVALIGLILIQHGRGADVGAAFGSGASGTVFGAQGSASFLTRVTAILATLFFINSMTLAYFVGQRTEKASVMEKVQPQVPPKPSEVPNVPSPNPSDLPPITAPADQTSGTPAPTPTPTSGTETPSPGTSTPPVSNGGSSSDVPSVPSTTPSELPPVTTPAAPTSSTSTPPASTDMPPPPVTPVTTESTPAPVTPPPTETVPTPTPGTSNP